MNQKNKKTVVIGFIFLFIICFVNLKKIEIDLIAPTQAEVKSIVKNNEITIKKPIQTENDTEAKSVEKNMTDVDVYCKLEEAKAAITMSGDIKIQFGQYGNYPIEYGQYAFVYSSTCPKDRYSVVRFDKYGNIKTELDCQTASMEDLAKVSSVTQWSLKETQSKSNEYNFALLNIGQLLVLCPDQGFQLTRVGHFVLNNGMLMNSDGCYLWHNGDELNPNGAPIVLKIKNDKLKEDGCFKFSKQCIATMDTEDKVVTSLKYIDSLRSGVDFNGDLKKTKRPIFYANAVEMLNSKERGPTGIVNWQYVSSLKFPIDCRLK